MSDCTLDFILPTSQLYKTSSWALRHHLFYSFFSFFCCTDGNHLLQRRPWTNFILLQILVLWTLDGGTHFDLMLDWIRFLRSTQDLYTPGNSQGNEVPSKNIYHTQRQLFSQTICRLLGFHWRFESTWWWYFDYLQIPTLMAFGKLRAILLLLLH